MAENIKYGALLLLLRIRSTPSRDTRISYPRCLLIQGYFCAVQNYAEKAELSKCSWYPKRKFRETIHFSKIIKLQSSKERHTLLCILNLSANYLRKVLGYPQFSFWISITLVKICFFRIFSKPHKNTFELVGTVLKNSLFAHQHIHKHVFVNWKFFFVGLWHFSQQSFKRRLKQN